MNSNIKIFVHTNQISSVTVFLCWLFYLTKWKHLPEKLNSSIKKNCTVGTGTCLNNLTYSQSRIRIRWKCSGSWSSQNGPDPQPWAMYRLQTETTARLKVNKLQLQRGEVVIINSMQYFMSSHSFPIIFWPASGTPVSSFIRSYRSPVL